MDERRVLNKVAIVTGAASGIGRAAAMLLAREGATTMVTDIDAPAAAAVCQSILERDGQADHAMLDVTRPSDWHDVVNRVIEQYHRLDILVNCAGISIGGNIQQLSLDDWQAVLQVNLTGVFLGTRQAIQAMSSGGSIVNVASVSGLRPSAEAAAYCASKSAVRMFSKSAAIECADANSGIRVNVVTPGGVRTEMWEKQTFFREMIDQLGSVDSAFAAIEGTRNSERFYSPDEVAETILFFASDASSHLNGTEIILDRGHTL